jgi:hypothetical protein
VCGKGRGSTVSLLTLRAIDRVAELVDDADVSKGSSENEIAAAHRRRVHADAEVGDAVAVDVAFERVV